MDALATDDRPPVAPLDREALIVPRHLTIATLQEKSEGSASRVVEVIQGALPHLPGSIWSLRCGSQRNERDAGRDDFASAKKFDVYLVSGAMFVQGVVKIVVAAHG